jgi:hypothetical protein
MSARIRSHIVAAAVAIGSSTPAAAQMIYQPHPAPLVSAESETWFTLGEPLTFNGHFYYPAGARVFFDGHRMVRTGSYRGIPLYADTTLEPYSKVFVPVGGGLLQPYERRRDGDLAGSVGSQAPSFPVTTAGEADEAPDAVTRETWPQAPGPPVFDQPADLEFEARMSDAARATAGRAAGVRAAAAIPSREDESVGTAGVEPQRNLVEAGTRPRGLNEIFVTYDGYRWRSAGTAIAFSEDRFERIGENRGSPVYVKRGRTAEPPVIYVPTRAGLVAPFERAGRPPTY